MQNLQNQGQQGNYNDQNGGGADNTTLYHAQTNIPPTQQTPQVQTAQTQHAHNNQYTQQVGSKTEGIIQQQKNESHEEFHKRVLQTLESKDHWEQMHQPQPGTSTQGQGPAGRGKQWADNSGWPDPNSTEYYTYPNKTGCQNNPGKPLDNSSPIPDNANVPRPIFGRNSTGMPGGDKIEQKNEKDAYYDEVEAEHERKEASEKQKMQNPSGSQGGTGHRAHFETNHQQPQNMKQPQNTHPQQFTQSEQAAQARQNIQYQQNTQFLANQTGSNQQSTNPQMSFQNPGVNVQRTAYGPGQRGAYPSGGNYAQQSMGGTQGGHNMTQQAPVQATQGQNMQGSSQGQAPPVRDNQGQGGYQGAQDSGGSQRGFGNYGRYENNGQGFGPPWRARTPKADWPKFFGKICWSAFMEQWAAVARQQKVTEEEKVEFLIPCIKGDAAVYLCDLDIKIKSDFKALEEKMRDAYEEEDTLMMAKLKLNKATQGEKSIHEFAMEVTTLANRLGDHYSPLLKETMAGEVFLSGVNDQAVVDMIVLTNADKYPKGIPLKVAEAAYKMAVTNKQVRAKNTKTPELTIQQVQQVKQELWEKMKSGGMGDDSRSSRRDNFQNGSLRRFSSRSPSGNRFGGKVQQMEKDVQQLNEQVGVLMNLAAQFKNRPQSPKTTQNGNMPKGGASPIRFKKGLDCFKCHKEGHYAHECTDGATKPNKCIACKGDHDTADCPKIKQIKSLSTDIDWEQWDQYSKETAQDGGNQDVKPGN